VHSEIEKTVITLLVVMSVFSILLGALRVCGDFHDSTDEYRLKQEAVNL